LCQFNDTDPAVISCSAYLSTNEAKRIADENDFAVLKAFKMPDLALGEYSSP